MITTTSFISHYGYELSTIWLLYVQNSFEQNNSTAWTYISFKITTEDTGGGMQPTVCKLKNKRIKL
jgi:hypothetical protein